ncbi:hypothetical protein LAZ67_12002698 [Cordylochernes scorpioides]|uniref:RNA-directed DNA polymerase n=1 Tax=Cordylochernes scorpioides TaxID=51811 RepID=A0ABY6L2G6_9ARAC|nr:hypothetical protein LAZ67_12002698 [Cordylochernes scorpioides]
MPKKVSVHRHSSPTYHTKSTHDHTSQHHKHANVPHNIHAPIRHHATNTHNPHNKRNTHAKRQQQQTSACTTVKDNTIIPSTQNIEKIHATKQPHNRKTLRSFLKAVNAYKEFIPDHARLRTPLVNLLKKDVMWVWDDKCQKAFTNLKENLTTHPTLHLYQEDLPCQVYCNTSTFSITGVLKQVYPDGKTYTVQHFSRSLRSHERNYSDLELQCLAIVESVDNFRTCLNGRKFTIFSDHPALQWLKEIKAPSGRLFRWRLRLSRYEYEVRSINGVQQYETGVGTRIPFCGFLDAPLIQSQQSSPPGKSRVTMDHNKLRTVSRKGVLKTIVPSSLTTRLLKSVHTQHHHPNIPKMTRLISSRYYWQNMTQDIAKQVKTCPTCRFARRIEEYNQPSRKNTDTGTKAKQNSYIKHNVHTTQTMPKLPHSHQRNDHTSQPKPITADISLIKPLTIKQENCKPDNQLNHITPLPKDIKQENCEPTNHSNSTIHKKTIVSAVASSYGLGAVLKQEHEANEWRPVAFSLRTLTKTEQGYAQIQYLQSHGRPSTTSCSQPFKMWHFIPIHIPSFYDVRDEIGEENGLLMNGLRVIIPSNIRKDVLKHIHAGTYRRNSLLLASSQPQVDPSETSPDSELPAETEETPGNELPAEELQQHSAKKCDLSKLAYELGEVVPPESRIVDLKRLILNSQSYEEEFAKQLLETLIEEREQTERERMERAERERMEQTARTEQAERAERERKEQMEFELEKLRIQTMHGNNDPSRGTSNNAHCEIRKLMPKYESKDSDLSFYLILFERQAKRLGLDEDQWAFSLLGLLPYEMTQLIARETEGQSGDYRFVKRLLLKRYKLSPEQFRQKFEKHDKSQEGSWRDFAFELRGYFNEWIEGMNVEDFDALKDLSVTNQLKKKVPNVLRNHLIDDWTKINNPDVLADKLDEYENVRAEMGPPHWNSKHTTPPSFQQKSARFPNRSEVKETEQGTNVSSREAARNEISEKYPNTSRRMVNRAIRNDKGEPKCFNCNQFGHIARDCPVPKATLTCRGCGQTGYKERNCTRPKEGLKDAKIDNKETVKAMIDTGSSSCLLRESVARRINVDIEPDATSLYGIGNQTAPAARTVGKTTVDLEIDGVVGKEIAVFIVNDDAQPYDLLIGRTWTDLPYVSFARIGKELHIGYSTEFSFANLQEEIKSRRVELRATETVQLGSDCINFASAITDEVRDGYVLFTGVDDCVNSLLEVVDGKTTVPIISVGKGNLRVKKNQCICRVELLSPDDIVVNLDVSEDSFQTKSEEKGEGQDQMKRKRPIVPEDVNINHSLTPKERQEILDVVNEYRDCFALGMGELGCTDVTKMDIKEVDGSKPVCLRPYKTTASEREAIREIVREWKDNGIVTETRPPYASPVLLVRKKTGDHRLVVDYRRLNIQTVKDKFPLPRIDDLLEGLRNAKFFTTLDLAHGYLQIPLTDKAKLKTAFITPDDTGQFERMIFGLANAPTEFQRLMHSVLGPLLNKKAFCYLDDVIIPAKDWREMIERLREVLERIRSAKLTLKPSKCEFGRREVEFLGYVISTGGLKPGPRKIKAIEEFPEPKNVHDIRRFLGLTNFFRRFVKDFARKAEPLSRLQKKVRTRSQKKKIPSDATHDVPATQSSIEDDWDPGMAEFISRPRSKMEIEEFSLFYMVDEVDLGYNRRGLPLMVK